MSGPTPKGPLHIGRFERRIVFAISFAAFVPLIAALILGRYGIRTAAHLGLNTRVREAMHIALAIREDHVRSLSERAGIATDGVCADLAIDALAGAGDDEALRLYLAELVDRDPDDPIAGIELFRGAVVGAADVAVSPDPDAGVVREVTTRRTPGGLSIRVTTLLSAEAAHNAVVLGEIDASLALVEQRANDFATWFLGIQAVLLLFVIVFAMAVAVLLSRRVTRRITLLADATDRVGAGDLTVQVPVDDRDEVGDLTRAFNAMVSDLRASRDRVEYLERVGAWQEMARRLAHEIKNPLTPIQLAVQQAHQAYKGDDARFRKTLEDAREIVDEEVQTLRRLVSEFSEFARLPEPSLAPLDLTALVRDASRTLDPAGLRVTSSERPAPTLTTELPREVVPVRADAEILRRCLDNLVRNAVQAIDERGGSTVIVAVRRDGADAILEVRDDGPGVPDDARERIFQPYFTTKELGTGLGLAIVKKAVLEHGGSIECVAAPEGGACFRVRLPRAPDGPHA